MWVEEVGWVLGFKLHLLLFAGMQLLDFSLWGSVSNARWLPPTFEFTAISGALHGQ